MGKSTISTGQFFNSYGKLPEGIRTMRFLKHRIFWDIVRQSHVWEVSEVMGVPQIIQVMDDHFRIETLVVTWGFLIRNPVCNP